MLRAADRTRVVVAVQAAIAVPATAAGFRVRRGGRKRFVAANPAADHTAVAAVLIEVNSCGRYLILQSATLGRALANKEGPASRCRSTRCVDMVERNTLCGRVFDDM